VRYRILREQWGLQPNLCPNPFALGMRCRRGVLTFTTAAENMAEFGAFNFIKMLELAEGFIANRPRDIDSRRTIDIDGSTRSVDSVKHQVNDDASHRDVEPERESPAGNGAVPVKPSAPCAHECDDD
jgi:hypothetical protein